jgi:hypothetical protein
MHPFARLVALAICICVAACSTAASVASSDPGIAPAETALEPGEAFCSLPAHLRVLSALNQLLVSSSGWGAGPTAIATALALTRATRARMARLGEENQAFASEVAAALDRWERAVERRRANPAAMDVEEPIARELGSAASTLQELADRATFLLGEGCPGG